MHSMCTPDRKYLGDHAPVRRKEETERWQFNRAVRQYQVENLGGPFDATDGHVSASSTKDKSLRAAGWRQLAPFINWQTRGCWPAVLSPKPKLYIGQVHFDSWESQTFVQQRLKKRQNYWDGALESHHPIFLSHVKEGLALCGSSVVARVNLSRTRPIEPCAPDKD